MYSANVVLGARLFVDFASLEALGGLPMVNGRFDLKKLRVQSEIGTFKLTTIRLTDTEVCCLGDNQKYVCQLLDKSPGVRTIIALASSVDRFDHQEPRHVMTHYVPAVKADALQWVFKPESMAGWQWLKCSEVNISEDWYKLTRDVVACALLSFEIEQLEGDGEDRSGGFLKDNGLPLPYARRTQPVYLPSEVARYAAGFDRQTHDHVRPLANSACEVDEDGVRYDVNSGAATVDNLE